MAKRKQGRFQVRSGTRSTETSAATLATQTAEFNSLKSGSFSNRGKHQRETDYLHLKGKDSNYSGIEST